MLAETLLERSLSEDADSSSLSVLGRVGCWVSAAVSARTTVALLRLRHRLVVRRARRERTLLVEEATGLAWAGTSAAPLAGPDALDLLMAPPAGDVPAHVRERECAKALAWVRDRGDDLHRFAGERAAALLADHVRVRAAVSREEAAEPDGRREQVEALPRPDVIGVFVLLPKVG